MANPRLNLLIQRDAYENRFGVIDHPFPRGAWHKPATCALPRMTKEIGAIPLGECEDVGDSFAAIRATAR